MTKKWLNSARKKTGNLVGHFDSDNLLSRVVTMKYSLVHAKTPIFFFAKKKKTLNILRHVWHFLAFSAISPKELEIRCHVDFLIDKGQISTLPKMAAIPIVFSFYTKIFSVFQIVIILFLGWTREYLIVILLLFIWLFHDIFWNKIHWWAPPHNYFF